VDFELSTWNCNGARFRHRLDTQAARVAPEFLQRQAAPHAPDVQDKIPAPVALPVRERRPQLGLGLSPQRSGFIKNRHLRRAEIETERAALQ
jgi:hypothetical protein